MVRTDGVCLDILMRKLKPPTQRKEPPKFTDAGNRRKKKKVDRTKGLAGGALHDCTSVRPCTAHQEPPSGAC